MKLLLIFCFAILLTFNITSGQTTPLWKTLPEVPAMPKADESGFATVNDIKMYYAIFNKDGQDPVILLHGGFTSSDDWSFEVPLLSKTHKVIIIDSRGHGRSSMSDKPLTYSLMASDVLQLMDCLQIKKASIVGWSDGGVIGLIMAIKYPVRINKLFTFGANYDTSGYSQEPMDTAMAARFMARVKANYHKLSPTPDSFAVLRRALNKMYSVEPAIKPAALQTIKAPTAIACGQYEQFIKPSHSRELASLIPNAKFIVMPNVSHGGPTQNPVLFHQAVMELLNGN